MINPYQRSMLFFTFIQGDLVNEWIVAMARWIGDQVRHNGVLSTNKWLWNEIVTAFRRRFANTLEREQARTILKRGIKMQGGDVDAYVTLFEKLA